MNLQETDYNSYIADEVNLLSYLSHHQYYQLQYIRKRFKSWLTNSNTSDLSHILHSLNF